MVWIVLLIRNNSCSSLGLYTTYPDPSLVSVFVFLWTDIWRETQNKPLQYSPHILSVYCFMRRSDTRPGEGCAILGRQIKRG
jgi:hypothetical protein